MPATLEPFIGFFVSLLGNAMQAPPGLTYAGYLHLREILGAQHPVAPDEHGPVVRAAEHFFIVTHQAFELWFKQLLLDLADAAEFLRPPSTDAEMALDHLQRARSIRSEEHTSELQSR